MECHPSIASFRDLIKMYQHAQTGTHLDRALDSECQDGARASSCRALRFLRHVASPDPSVEVKENIIADIVDHRKRPFFPA